MRTKIMKTPGKKIRFGVHEDVLSLVKNLSVTDVLSV